MTRPPSQLRPLLDAGAGAGAEVGAPRPPPSVPKPGTGTAPLTAVVLAADSGARFRKAGVDTPKPLLPLGGLPLLERTLRTARRAGLERFVVVLGHRGDEVRAALAPRLADLDVRWVLHPGWPQGSGSALLAARPHVGGAPFLVLMGDHLLGPGLLEGLRRAPTDGRVCVMAVDRERAPLDRPGDANRVRTLGDRVVAVGKRLGLWNAVDTGAALCTPALFDALEEAARAEGGACAHAEGLRRLAARGLLRFHDVAGARWADVDSPEAWRAAERLLYETLREPGDGPLARQLERRLSLALTRRLAPTRVRPDHLTALSVALGLAAAALFAQPERGAQVVAAVLFWCASWTGGCDGELARLRFRGSRRGALLDFAGAHVVHLAVFVGMGVGLARASGEPRWRALGAVAALGVAAVAAWVYRTRLRPTGGFAPDGAAARGALGRALDAPGRREFVFAGLLLVPLGGLPALLWAAAVGTWARLAALVGLHLARRPTRA